MDPYETAVDRAIREAAEGGAFDNLAGAGKPLPMRQAGDADWWLKELVEREQISGSELVPPTIALRREADGFPESLAGLASEESVRQVLDDFNERVRADWRRPGVGKGTPVIARPVDVDQMVERWKALRPQP